MSYLNTSMVKSAFVPSKATLVASLVGTGAGALAGARQTTGTGSEKAKGALLGGILAGGGAAAGSRAMRPVINKLRGKAAIPLRIAGALAGGYGGYKLRNLFDT